jgi:hypothetical protein
LNGLAPGSFPIGEFPASVAFCVSVGSARAEEKRSLVGRFAVPDFGVGCKSLEPPLGPELARAPNDGLMAVSVNTPGAVDRQHSLHPRLSP